MAAMEIMTDPVIKKVERMMEIIAGIFEIQEFRRFEVINTSRV
jgi:hypothetical protein